MPVGRSRRGQASGRPHVDESLDAAAETSREDPRELDLEPSGEDHVAAAHDACLKARFAEAERDDERGLSGGRGRICRGRRADDRERRDEQEHDARHARLQRTSTGVPYVANAYITGASAAIIRMQPCEAGYAGTDPYAWKAIPPTK